MAKRKSSKSNNKSKILWGGLAILLAIGVVVGIFAVVNMNITKEPIDEDVESSLNQKTSVKDIGEDGSDKSGIVFLSNQKNVIDVKEDNTVDGGSQIKQITVYTDLDCNTDGISHNSSGVLVDSNGKTVEATAKYFGSVQYKNKIKYIKYGAINCTNVYTVSYKNIPQGYELKWTYNSANGGRIKITNDGQSKQATLELDWEFLADGLKDQRDDEKLFFFTNGNDTIECTKIIFIPEFTTSQKAFIDAWYKSIK